MTYRASAHFKGNSRSPMVSGLHAGASATVLIAHVFDKDAVNTTDVLELYTIPAGASVVGFTWNSENLPAGNTTMGIMSGTPGDASDARTGGSEFVNAVAHATTNTDVALPTLAAVAKSDVDRSLCFKTSANISVAANRKLHVRITLQF